MSINIDFVSLHPIFKLGEITRIIFCEEVIRESNHRKKEKRLLVVTNFGILLIRKQKFPKSLQISAYIAFCDCRYILLDREMIMISDNPQNPKFKEKIISDKVIKIASIIYILCNTLFTSNSICNFNCSSDVRQAFEESNFLYDPVSIISERFISFVFSRVPAKSLNDSLLEIIKDIIEKLKGSVTMKTFTFNAGLVASNFINDITNTISFDQDITTIILEDLNYSSFSPYFIPIINLNAFIKTLIMKNIGFSGQPLTNFSKKPQFQIESIEISGCNMTSSDAISFLDLMKTFKESLTKLNFSNSTFSKDVILYLFEIISFIDNLELLKFENCGATLLLENSLIPYLDTVIERNKANPETKTLRHFLVVNCNIELAKIISMIGSSFIKLTRVNLSGNKFTNLPVFQQQLEASNEITFNNLDELYLNNCKFTTETFQAFFNMISKPACSITSLHLDLMDFFIPRHSNRANTIVSKTDAEMSEKRSVVDNAGENLGEAAYDLIKNIKLPSLMSLTWSQNRLSKIQTELFLIFLRNNNHIYELEFKEIVCDIDTFCSGFGRVNFINLEKLAIQGSDMNKRNGENAHPLTPPPLPPKNHSEQSPPTLIPSARAKPIARYTIRSSSVTTDVISEANFSFGPKLLQLLSPLTHLKYLDITNQRIGDGVIPFLNGLLQQATIQELYFDGQLIQNCDAYLQILKDIIEYHLASSKWPQNDVQKLITCVPIAKRNEVRNNFDKLKKDFTFDSLITLKNRHSSKSRFQMLHSPRKLSSPVHQHPKIFDDNEIEKEANNEIDLINLLSYQEDEIKELIEECLHIDSPMKDILVSKYQSINT